MYIKLWWELTLCVAMATVLARAGVSTFGGRHKPPELRSLGSTIDKLALDRTRSGEVCALQKTRSGHLSGRSGRSVKNIGIHPMTFHEGEPLKRAISDVKPSDGGHKEDDRPESPDDMMLLSPTTEKMIRKGSVQGSAHMVGGGIDALHGMF
mmetsp:Transcript_115896/g.205209  ORF Transcript_115896/g.205209 Transcript_115896/m.205209 type:complete len:152 (-) Transcript_115896:113-568(-)